MGVPEERYSKIIGKNQREICLLRGFPCAWGKCAFCDYIEDNGRDTQAMVSLNHQVLQKVTGEFGVLEVIKSACLFKPRSRKSLSKVSTPILNTIGTGILRRISSR